MGYASVRVLRGLTKAAHDCVRTTATP
jgi:hypothetical protein